MGRAECGGCRRSEWEKESDLDLGKSNDGVNAGVCYFGVPDKSSGGGFSNGDPSTPGNLLPRSVATAPAVNTASADTFVARSIRCKDLDLNVLGTLASKKMRVHVISAKTKEMVRVGGKIVIKYFDEHRGSAIKAIHYLISYDISSCMRDRVPILAETYAELPKDHGQIVYDYLLIRALCERMKRVRRSEKKKYHCSGMTSFFFRAKKHDLKGAPAPHVEAYAEVYEKNDPQTVEKMRARMTALVEEQRAEHPLRKEGEVEMVAIITPAWYFFT
ncbi:hypothetical protein LguiB_015396 [Lonicera macranthoides]